MDLSGQISSEVALAPVVATDDTVLTGRTMDLGTAKGATFIVQTGTLADANATFAMKLQHGDASDLSDAADCAANEYTGDSSFTFANDLVTKTLEYLGNKKYARVVITPSGNGGNAPLSAVMIRHGEKKQP